VASSSDTATRLVRLEQILAQTTSATENRSDVHAADVHLSSVPAERIRRLTAELADDAAREHDPVDAVVMRLLLNEYATAVGHLRAVARMAATRIDGAAVPMREARRALHRHTKSIESAGPNWLTKNSKI
jgi:predicted nucleotidyltransferase